MRCTEKSHIEREDKEQLLNGENLMPRGIKNHEIRVETGFNQCEVSF